MRYLILLAVLLSACSSSPTSPTPVSVIPQVAGAYNGNVTITLPEVQQSRTCPATTSVTQAGSSVNIAPIVLTGPCGTLSIPVGQMAIDTTGAILGQNTGSFFEPTCGGNYQVIASGGFFGREMRLSITGTSAVCLNFNFTATLTR